MRFTSTRLAAATPPCGEVEALLKEAAGPSFLDTPPWQPPVPMLTVGRFLLTEPNPAPPDSPLHLIVNWFEELKAKVPPPR